jgi:hemin uptake protein HemP
VQVERTKRDQMAADARLHPATADGVMPEIAAETILLGRREIVLLHNGLRYRLRITSNNKLILTK